jgi:hypothetical protein
MRAALNFVIYHSHIQLKHIASGSAGEVVGVSNEYACVGGGIREVRFAVMEEADCWAEPETFVEIARRASEEAFGEDLVAMVVQTRNGFHIYLDKWSGNYFDALLLSAKYRDHLPCLCRDYKHVWSAVAVFMKLKWYRYVLRVSPTKHLWDWFRVVYRRKSRDECHESFLAEVERLYRAGEVPVP